MLVTSGYGRGQAREIIVSGLRGWMNKKKRREENGQEFYRSAASSLATRYKKKLTAIPHGTRTPTRMARESM